MSFMPGIPGTIWDRPDTLAALRARDITRVFWLVRQHAGISQTAIGSLIGMSQGKVSSIMAGGQQITALDVYERIADGLRMPDIARVTLGLAPRHIPVRDGSGSVAPGTVRPARSVERDSRPEEGGAVHRREFVGLTGAAFFGDVVAAVGPAHGIDDLVTALTEIPAPAAGPADLNRLSAMVASAKRDYQACKYGDVLTMLPPLMRSLRTVAASAGSPHQCKARALSAEAYHVGLVRT